LLNWDHVPSCWDGNFSHRTSILQGGKAHSLLSSNKSWNRRMRYEVPSKVWNLSIFCTWSPKVLINIRQSHWLVLRNHHPM
jgi:hypothetical protein